MLAPGSRRLDNSKVYTCQHEIKAKILLLNISYTNSEISIGRPYIHPILQLTTQASPMLEPQPQFADIHIGSCHG